MSNNNNNNYQRNYSYQIPQNNYKQMSNYSNSNINQQNNNYSQSNNNPEANCQGYVCNNSIYENQKGYSNSTGIYDKVTLMFVNSLRKNNNIFQNMNSNDQIMFQNNMNNSNQIMSQNNMNNSNQNMYQNNMNNSNQNMYQNNMNNSNQNVQQFNNNKNYQQINNNIQNMQQNYYNKNQEQFIQNSNSPNMKPDNINNRRNNYNKNIQRQFSNNDENLQQQNNSNLTQRNFDPNMNIFNNQNNFLFSQKSQFIPEFYNDAFKNEFIRNNQRRLSQHTDTLNNNIIIGQINNKINNFSISNKNLSIHYNNYENNPQNQYNNAAPNQYSNISFNNRNNNQPIFNNQNFNNNPQIQNDNQQSNIENQMLYSYKINDNNYNQNNNNIQKLTDDIQNNLNIDQHNQMAKQKENDNNNQKDKEEEEKEEVPVLKQDERVLNLEDDVLVSVFESVRIEDLEEKEGKLINNDDNNDKKGKENSNNLEKSNNYNSNKPNKKSYYQKNNSKMSIKKDEEEEEELFVLKDLDFGEKAFNAELTNTILDSEVNNSTSSTKAKDNNDIETKNNNNNLKEVEDEKEKEFDIKINENGLTDFSVLESVEISKEMPTDAHDHPLSNESLNNETCIICNKSQTCEQGNKCKECSLIICDMCSISIRGELQSHFKHEHSLCITKGKNIQCNVCKKETKYMAFYFNCKQCNYNICLYCYNPYRKKEDNALLLHEHPLIKFNETNLIKCQMCESEIKSGYKCSNCQIFLCYECTNNIYSHKKKQEFHEHPLFLNFRDQWSCAFCNSSFKNTLSFYCKKCNLDYCVDCLLE